MKKEAAFWALVAILLYGAAFLFILILSPDLCTWFMLPFLIFGALVTVFAILGREKR